MSQRSNEEILSDLKQYLGDEFGNMFHKIESYYVELCTYWHDYCTLFGANQERFDLMNKSAPSFFYKLDRMHFEFVLLSICRLSDPKKDNNNNENLSVNQLEQFMRNDGEKKN